MTRSIQSERKLEDFINKLESLGYGIQEVRKKPQIYSINGELINIRSRGKHKDTNEYYHNLIHPDDYPSF